MPDDRPTPHHGATIARPRWIQPAAGVFVVRHAALDLNLGLILGVHACLVVDTGFGEDHGATFVRDLREHTALPASVVLTHAHLDHCLGTAALAEECGPVDVYAHPDCAAQLAAQEPPPRTEWARFLRSEGLPDEAADATHARLVPPNRQVTEHALDLGQRTVRLLHPGRGHTDGDLIVHVPDAGLVFAGDLVEQGAPPQAGEDAYPSEWPTTLDALLALAPRLVVPGHGEPVDAAFVRAQRDELTARYPS